MTFAMAMLMAVLTPVHGAQRPLWTGAETLSEDSLFKSFRDVRDAQSFIAEPLRPGEDLPSLLHRLGVPAAEAVDAAAAFAAEAPNLRLGSAATVRVKLSSRHLSIFQLAAGGGERSLIAFEMLAGPDRLVTVRRTAEGFAAGTRPLELETRYLAAAGEISQSLFVASAAAGVPRDVMLRFADVFAFDVDFGREIYRGDRFEIVYEVLVDKEGRIIAPGDIVFAALSWKGRAHDKGYYLFEHDDDRGYFGADGRNPRTLLMRTPINGARVTSRFGPRRHPVLGYTKGHAGVDFGAARGTPILAAGDGTVSLAGPRGSFGNYVRIDHAGGYQTVYAHMQGFAPGIRRGGQVRQGQIIGYVGTTGRSTGPHLHYEVRLNGAPQNPETVSVAVGETLSGDDLAAFEDWRTLLDDLRVKPLAIAARTAR